MVNLHGEFGQRDTREQKNSFELSFLARFLIKIAYYDQLGPFHHLLKISVVCSIYVTLYCL